MSRSYPGFVRVPAVNDRDFYFRPQSFAGAVDTNTGCNILLVGVANPVFSPWNAEAVVSEVEAASYNLLPG